MKPLHSRHLRPHRRLATALACTVLFAGAAAAQSPPPALSLPFGSAALAVQAIVPPTKVSIQVVPPSSLAPPLLVSADPRELSTAARQVWGTQLTWTQLPDGSQVAHVVLQSPAAQGVRVLLGLRGAPQATLRFVGDAPGAAVHAAQAVRYTATRPQWSPLTTGERMLIELQVPAPTRTAGIVLDLLKVSHQRAPAVVAQAATTVSAEVCETQFSPVCMSSAEFNKPHWQRARSAVGRLHAVRPSGRGVSCTATLVHHLSAAGTEDPLLLTAAHCLVDDTGVPTQAVADSVGMDFFFEEATCGQRDFRFTKSVFTGARLLYASASRDIALLRLNSPPPEGVQPAFLDLTPQPSAVKNFFHHPKGDAKRFGVAIDTGTEVSLRYDPPPFADRTLSVGPLRQMRTATLTPVFGGSSGSPVFHVQSNPGSPSGDLPLVVGVLSGADLRTSCGKAQDTFWAPLANAAAELRPVLSQP